MLDSHCHLNDEKLLADYPQVIQEARDAGVKTLLVVGWDVESSKKAIEIAEGYDGVYAAVGIHPENIEGLTLETIHEIEKLAVSSKKVIAIGEIGLDYHWYKEESHRQRQKEFFIEQIKLANKLGLPISIHARDAIQDTFDILKVYPVKHYCVLHCYSGSSEMLKEFAKLGCYFGFDGPLTYKNAIEPKKCVEICPIDRLLTETDSPYLPPTPFRGQTNYPKYIKYILEEMAGLKGLTSKEMGKQVEDNFYRLFHMKQYDETL